MDSVIIPILSLVVVLNFIVGIAIVSRDIKKKINFLFGLICFGVALWATGILGFYLIKFPLDSIWIIDTHLSAAFIAVIFLIFTFNFPRVLIKNFYIRILPLLPFLIIAYSLFFTDNIIGNVRGMNYEINSGYIFYSIYIMLYFFIGYFSLIMQYKKSSNDEQKIQVNYVLFGSFLSSILAGVMDLALPYFGIFQYTWLGPVFTFFMVGTIAYAILKHHLFDVKVVATELFIFAIWIILFTKIFFSSGFQDQLLNSFIFLSVLFFGVMMIRAVLKDLKQKEQIEKMAKDMEKAYEVEKKARQELEALDKSKNQFLLTIQHHLRTPLTSMMGYTDLLLKGQFGRVPVKIKEVILKFENSTNTLIKMVNEFLDITQFQLGKEVVMLKSGVAVEPILEQTINDLTLEAKKKGIYLQLEKSKENHFIKADESKLRAAIVNIIDNAVKYTTKGGVKVSIKDENDKIIILIKDTGMGIPKERIDNLFDKIFERSEEAKKTFVTGRGIGLYLAGQVVRVHNGKVWAESEGEGKGSTFFIELPIESVKK